MSIFEGAKEVACDLCGSSDSIEVPHCREYTNNQPIQICKSCGLVFFKYRRSPEALAKFWEEEMFKSGEYTSHNPTFKSRHVYAVEFIEKHIGLKNISLADIGAGEGQFLDMCRERGANIFGIESSRNNSGLLKKMNIPHFNGTIEDYVSEIKNDKHFVADKDIVTILWTLQNSQSCVDMLDAANMLLKEDGYIFIQMGSRILVPFKKPLGTYFSTLPQDDQPYHFSVNTLQGVLAKCGFEVYMTNNYWDEDLLCILAQKRPKDEKIEWVPDDYREVMNFFDRWHAESEAMKKYLKILPLNYRFSKTHTFYNYIEKKQV